ncbi:MAG: hypothetical protein AABZ60_09170 [Planctomycetota bacterium]
MKKKKIKIGIGIVALILLIGFSIYQYMRLDSLSYFETTYKKQIDCLIAMVKNPALQLDREFHEKNRALFDSSEFIVAECEVDYSTGMKPMGMGKFVYFDDTLDPSNFESSFIDEVANSFYPKLGRALLLKCRFGAKKGGPPISVLWYQGVHLDPKGTLRSIKLFIHLDSLKKRDPQAPF